MKSRDGSRDTAKVEQKEIAKMKHESAAELEQSDRKRRKGRASKKAAITKTLLSHHQMDTSNCDKVKRWLLLTR